jgi:hypothetical protein
MPSSAAALAEIHPTPPPQSAQCCGSPAAAASLFSRCRSMPHSPTNLHKAHGVAFLHPSSPQDPSSPAQPWAPAASRLHCRSVSPPPAPAPAASPHSKEVCEALPAPMASTPSQDKNPDFTVHARSRNIGPLPDGLARQGCTRPWGALRLSPAGRPSSARCTTFTEVRRLARGRAVRAARGMRVLCGCCVREFIFLASLRPLLPPALEGGREGGGGVVPRRSSPRCELVNLYARSTPADVPRRRAAADEELPTWKERPFPRRSQRPRRQ